MLEGSCQAHNHPGEGHCPVGLSLGDLDAPAQESSQDLLEQLTEEDLARVTVLYVSRNTQTPDAPGNEPQLRRRQRDAALVAWERANAIHDKRQTEWQEVLVADHKVIYRHAAERLSKIFADKDHYIHQKAGLLLSQGQPVRHKA